MSARPRILGFMGLITMLASSSRSDGYICVGADQAALPMLGSPAPLNTPVWLFLPTHYKTIRCDAPPCEGRFVVRPAVGSEPAYDVTIAAVRETTSGDVT